MGCALKQVECLMKILNKQNLQIYTSRNDEEVDKILKERENYFKNIPNNQLLCPKCGEDLEIKDFHYDNRTIEFKCKFCNINEKKLEFYYEEIKKSKEDNVNISITNSTNISNNSNEKKEKFNYFCETCQIIVCEKDLKNHKDYHKLKNIEELKKDFKEYRKIIIKKNKDLSNIIKLNKIIVNTAEKYQSNYFHLQSIINLGKYIEKENTKSSKDIALFSYEIKENEETVKKVKEDFYSNYSIHLEIYQESLILNKKKLNDEYFKLISLINFNSLVEIDVSGNEIKNIQPFNKMSLPYLEYLNLSDNNIEDIEPVKELKCYYLKELFLHKNKINSINSLLDCDFPKLEILRVEDNKIGLIEEEIQKKYKNKIIFELKKFEDFKKKYKYENFKNKCLDLSEKGQGDDMIKDLYLVLTNNLKNNLENNLENIEIHKLILRNNKITESSKLYRFHLPYLQILNLSQNDIKSLNFLEKMNLNKLSELYLDNNKINKIYSLIKITSKESDKVNLKILTLKNNNFDIEDKQIKEILKDLKSKKIDIDIDIKIN